MRTYLLALYSADPKKREVYDMYGEYTAVGAHAVYMSSLSHGKLQSDIDGFSVGC